MFEFVKISLRVHIRPCDASTSCGHWNRCCDFIESETIIDQFKNLWLAHISHQMSNIFVYASGIFAGAAATQHHQERANAWMLLLSDFVKLHNLQRREKTEKDFAVFSHFKWKLPLSSCADLKWKLFGCIRWIFYTLSIFSVHGNRPNSIYQKKCYIYENQIKCAPQNKKVINSLSSCCDPAKQKQKICISANTSSECEKLVICSVSASFMICVCDDAFDCRSKWPFASTIQFG